MGNMIGGVGVLSHPLLVGVKQGIPVTTHQYKLVSVP